jgi:hypothetical protein
MCSTKAFVLCLKAAEQVEGEALASSEKLSIDESTRLLLFMSLTWLEGQVYGQCSFFWARMSSTESVD